MTVATTRSPRAAAAEPAKWGIPTRRANLMFCAKRMLHQLRRGAQDFLAGPQLLSKSGDAAFSVMVGASSTPLWSEAQPEERLYELGKVHNLRRAAAALQGVVVPAGALFSFWKQIGRTARRRGFVAGRMLQEGCLIPATGGGLCQLSNALYETALQAGCEIVERHAHSRIVPGAAAADGRDATVAWNYVDLRFRPRDAMRIEAQVTRDELIVRFRARTPSRNKREPRPQAVRATPVTPGVAARTCATCGETGCFRHEHRIDNRHGGIPDDDRCAFLVDENWPEFQEFVENVRRSGDVLGLPLDGATWRLPRYDWKREGFADVGSAPLQALRRALEVRWAPAQGPARRTAEQAGAERIAARLSRLLVPDVTKVVVAQWLLPFLWRNGHLGGRDVEVLMTRLPMQELHARLDRAFAAHPERKTLGDFRAPAELIEAEAEALAYASRIITPHSEIGRLFAEKAIMLDWRRPAVLPRVEPTPSARRIAFPGPTVARKGAYEVRDAARALDLDVLLLGSELEGPDFWDGVRTRKFDNPCEPNGWLKEVALVVQPAIAEERPRYLLAALAADVPVIAAPACGLASQDLLTIVPANDLTALIAALRASLP